MKSELKYNNLIIYVVIYFFFNSFLLPEGLLYTTILTPVMLYFLFKEGKLKYVWLWSLALLLPIPFQIYFGVEATSYALSNIMLFTALVFLISSIYLLRKFEGQLDEVFRKVLIINSFFVVVALLLLPLGEFRILLWYDIPITKGLEVIPRLKLATYEASYYSLIMMPIFIYFFLRIFFQKEKHPVIIFIAIAVPMLLSLSFGVIGAMIIAGIVSVTLYWKKIPVSLQKFTFIGGIFISLVLVSLFFIWPDNPVYFRISNIFQGKDTSAMGRLYYSFVFAKDLITHHCILFGIGPGQIKIVAHDMIINHYQYHGTLETIVRIPNSMGEMLAIYGIYGFLLKLFLEVYFFIKMKLYSNMFALLLFLSVFIYQFTGSYISNIAELGIWAIIFSVRFKEFDLISISNDE